MNINNISSIPWVKQFVQVSSSNASKFSSKTKAVASTALAPLETFQKVGQMLSGRAANWGNGERFQLFNKTPLAEDPYAPLKEVQADIHNFHQIKKGESVNDLNLAPPTSKQLEEQTNKNLDVLINKVSDYSTFYILHIYICGMPKGSEESLLHLVDQSSKIVDGKKTSLWKVFYKNYKSQLSFTQIIKSALFYFLCYKIPIIPNTIDAYLKNLLNVLRTNLKKDSATRSEFIQELVNINSTLLQISNGATKDFAEQVPIKGEKWWELQTYKEEALRQRVGISEEKLVTAFFKRLIHRYPTRIPFPFCEKILNWIIPWVLKKWVAPKVAVALLEETTNSIRRPGTQRVVVNEQEDGTQQKGAPKKTEERPRYYIPFFLALTETLNDQLEALLKLVIAKKKEQNNEFSVETTTELTNIENIQGLPEFVAHLIEAIHLSGPAKVPGIPEEPESIESVKKRIEKLKEPSFLPIKEKIQAGIQDGLLEGTRVLLDYLADPNNTETLFAKLTQRLSDPLSGRLTVNSDEWKSQPDTYKSQIEELKRNAKTLLKAVIDPAIEKAVGIHPPDKTAARAKQIFEQRKQTSLQTFEGIKTCLGDMRDKINRSESSWSQSTSIEENLEQITQSIGLFRDRETIEEEIKKLPPAEQKAIQIPLQPIYKKVPELTKLIGELEGLEQNHASLSKNNHRLVQIRSNLLKLHDLIQQQNFTVNHPELKTIISSLHKEIHALEKGALLDQNQIASLKEKFEQMIEQLTLLTKSESAIEALQQIHSSNRSNLLNDLILHVQGKSPRRFSKGQCIKDIKHRIEIGVTDKKERDLLLKSLNNILHCKKENISQLEEMKRAVLEKLDLLKKERESQRTAALSKISIETSDDGQMFLHAVIKTQNSLDQGRADCWKNVNNKAELLHTKTSELYTLIQKSTKEILLQITPKDHNVLFGVAGATAATAIDLGAGFLFGIPVSWIGAINGLGMAGAYSGVKNFTKAATLQGASKIVGGLVAGAAMGAFAFTHAPIALGIGAAATGYGMAAATGRKQAAETLKKEALEQATELFEKAYDNILTSDFLYRGNIDLGMKTFMTY